MVVDEQNKDFAMGPLSGRSNLATDGSFKLYLYFALEHCFFDFPR